MSTEANPRIWGTLSPRLRSAPGRVPGYVPFADENGCGLLAEKLQAGRGFMLPEFLAPAAAPDARVCKKGRHIRAVCAGGYFFKEYLQDGFWRNLRYAFRSGRPPAVLRCAEFLRALRVATPEVVLAYSADRRWRHSSDWLVTRELPPDTLYADHVPPADYPVFVGEIVSLLAELHAAGFEHGDLNLRNIYRAGAAPGRNWGFIDLDGARIGARALSPMRRCREIARIASSAARARGINRDDGDAQNILQQFADGYSRESGLTLPSRVLRAYHREMLSHTHNRPKNV